MKLNGNSQEVFEKLARMMYQEVPREQICMVLNCNEEELQTVLDLEEYRKVYGALIETEFENQNLKVESWDSLEAMALGNLVQSMQWNKDPELNLKVAVMANKANRSRQSNQPLEAVAESRTTVLTLNKVFIERLENADFGGRAQDQVERKKQDYLDVTKVEKMLGFSPGLAVPVEAK